MDLLADRHSSDLQYWGSSLRGTQNVWGRTELSGFRMRTGGAASTQAEVLVGNFVPFVLLFSLHAQEATVSESPSTKLKLFALSW